MTSPSTPSSSTTTAASTAAPTTASASPTVSETTSGPASTSSGNFTREDFISQQQAVLCENAEHLAYFDYVAIRMSQTQFAELDLSDPEAHLLDTLWTPYTEDLEQLRVLQADHREAFKLYFAGEYDSDKEESALRSRILDTASSFQKCQVFVREQMSPLLALVNKLDLNDHDRLVDTKIHVKHPKREPSDGGGRGRWFMCGCILSVAILVMMVICYWYYSGGGSTAKGESSSEQDGTSTHAQWTTTKAVDGPGGYGGSEEPTSGSKDPTFAPDDLTYGPYGPRPVPKERSLPYEEDPSAPLHRPNKDSGYRTVGLIILITLLVAVSVMILAIVAYNRLTAGGSHDFQDLESGLMNTESQETDTDESAADIES